MNDTHRVRPSLLCTSSTPYLVTVRRTHDSTPYAWDQYCSEPRRLRRPATMLDTKPRTLELWPLRSRTGQLPLTDKPVTRPATLHRTKHCTQKRAMKREETPFQMQPGDMAPLGDIFSSSTKLKATGCRCGATHILFAA